MSEYNDQDTQMRRKMIRNIPYLQHISEEIVNNIIYLMQPQRFLAGTKILKRGDNIDRLMLLKSGSISVFVPHFEGENQNDLISTTLITTEQD